jgi:hypothetical protein
LVIVLSILSKSFVYLKHKVNEPKDMSWFFGLSAPTPPPSAPLGQDHSKNPVTAMDAAIDNIKDVNTKTVDKKEISQPVTLEVSTPSSRPVSLEVSKPSSQLEVSASNPLSLLVPSVSDSHPSVSEHHPSVTYLKQIEETNKTSRAAIQALTDCYLKYKNAREEFLACRKQSYIDNLGSLLKEILPVISDDYTNIDKNEKNKDEPQNKNEKNEKHETKSDHHSGREYMLYEQVEVLVAGVWERAYITKIVNKNEYLYDVFIDNNDTLAEVHDPSHLRPIKNPNVNLNRAFQNYCKAGTHLGQLYPVAMQLLALHGPEMKPGNLLWISTSCTIGTKTSTKPRKFTPWKVISMDSFADFKQNFTANPANNFTDYHVSWNFDCKKAQLDMVPFFSELLKDTTINDEIVLYAIDTALNYRDFDGIHHYMTVV